MMTIILIMIFTILSPIAYVAGRLVAFKRKSIYEDQGLEIIEHNYTPT
ncbi:hypothetical protein [Peribacillus frigoritolerans]|nr:hypothetical protein [Peribacillus frigoritolerans]MDG4850522.1 hypothetical protein [Peribacillus frigoritolerans]